MNYKLFDGFERNEARDSWFKDEPIRCGYCGRPSECEISIRENDGTEKECCNTCDKKFSGEK